jgi:uncharacterized protein (TIRG00374 family)
MRRGVILAVLTLAGLGLFSLIITLSGPGAVWVEIKALGLWGFLAMLGNEFLAIAFWVLSWWVVLWALGLAPGLWEVLGAGIAGYAVSYITPMMYLGGEPVRAILISRRNRRPLTTVSATIVVDRLLAGLSLVTLAIIGGAFIITSFPLGEGDKWALVFGIAAMATAVGLGIFSFAGNYHWLSRIIGFCGRLSNWKRLSTLASRALEMERDIHTVFTQHLSKTMLAFLLQILSMLCTYLRPLIFFSFAKGVRFSFAELTVYFNLNAILTAMFWFTPAGIGTAEGGRVGIFQLLGIPPAAATGFSLVVRFFELTLVGFGFVYIAEQGLLQLAKGRVRGSPVSGEPKKSGAWLGIWRGILETGGIYFYGLFNRWLPHLFARRYRRLDPWNYETSPYERRKYDLTLAAIPHQPQHQSQPPYRRVLEVGCAEGVFTEKLAQAGSGQEIVGLDFMSVALDRARARCQGSPNVQFVHMDITKEAPSGNFDLIFCSEVLYYLGPRRLRKTAERIFNMLTPGGHLILVNPWPAAKLLRRPFLRQGLVQVGEWVERDSSRPYAITVLERAPQ